jgi:predicted DNA-binding helix-hairpin-helix protein
VCGEVLAPPVPPLRQHRLYQADWLLRFYGFVFLELPFQEDGSLPREADPKAAWALLHPERFPIEVNQATYDELLRVPGIGPVSAKRILALRAELTFRDLRDLSRLGVAVKRARQFLLLDGRYLGDRLLAGRPTLVRDLSPVQLSLWGDEIPLLEPMAA